MERKKQKVEKIEKDNMETIIQQLEEEDYAPVMEE